MVSRDEPVRVTRDTEDAAVAVLTDAFLDDPMLNYVSGGSSHRRRVAYIVGTVVSYGVRYGQVWATPPPTMRGAAIWMPPNSGSPTLIRRIRTGMITERFELGAAGARRFSLFNATSDALHHQVMPDLHWVLFVLGVGREHQRQGIGADLVRHMLQRTDREQRPVYLTAYNPEVIPFYRRLGFEVGGEADMPDGSLHIWGLVRYPGAR